MNHRWMWAPAHDGSNVFAERVEAYVAVLNTLGILW